MRIPTKKEYDMAGCVLNDNMPIKETAKAFMASTSTVRRAMETVTNFERKKFSVDVNGRELRELLGWLRNGNHTANTLADRITADIERK